MKRIDFIKARLVTCKEADNQKAEVNISLSLLFFRTKVEIQKYVY